MNLNKKSLLFCLLLIAVTTIVKILCAPQISFSGVTGIIAVSLFAGLMVKDKSKAFALPLLTLFASDVLIQILYALNLFPFAGFYSGQITNYLLLILVTLLAVSLRNLKTTGIIAAAFVGPTFFFLASNFFVWQMQGSILNYPKTFGGLMDCYAFGLPFYRNSLISTVIFLPAFIALYNWMQYGRLSLQEAKQHA